MSLRTEYEFVLPKGYVDDNGVLHRKGTMRLANGREEIEPLRDPRVQANESFLTVIILARVITNLGTLGPGTTTIIENLFVADLAYPQEPYSVLNFGTEAELKALEESQTPFESV